MKVINESEFDSLVINAKGLIIVDFFATWCGPCRMLAPELEEASEELGIVCYKVDVDESENLARKHGIMAVPTVYIYKDGKIVNHFNGYRTKEEIIEFINECK